MFKKGTGYSKACLVWLMLVLRLGKKDFIENCLFCWSLAMTLIKPKLLATIDLTFPNYLEKELVI